MEINVFDKLISDFFIQDVKPNYSIYSGINIDKYYTNADKYEQILISVFYDFKIDVGKNIYKDFIFRNNRFFELYDLDGKKFQDATTSMLSAKKIKLEDCIKRNHRGGQDTICTYLLDKEGDTYIAECSYNKDKNDYMYNF